jgi:hypothetical protein
VQVVLQDRERGDDERLEQRVRRTAQRQNAEN